MNQEEFENSYRYFLVCSINIINDDRILQLSIINDTGKTIFDKYFKPHANDIYYTHLIMSKLSEKRVNERCGSSFEDYIEELQHIFSKSKVVLFYDSKKDIDVLKKNGITLNPDTVVIDVMSMFSDMYYGCDNSKRYVAPEFHVATEFYNVNQNTDSIDTLKRAKEIMCVYDELVHRKLEFEYASESSNCLHTEEYAMKEFAKKIVMKYNKDFENNKFTIQDLNSIFDNCQDLPKTVQQIILYTLQTNFCLNKIIYDYHNDPILHQFLDKIDMDSCIHETKNIKDLWLDGKKYLMFKLQNIENMIPNDFNKEIINNYIDSLTHHLKIDILLFLSLFLLSLLLYFIFNH